MPSLPPEVNDDTYTSDVSVKGQWQVRYDGRVTIEIKPPEVEREGLDVFVCIDKERREVLERRPASSVVVELVYPKYVRKDRDRGGASVLMRSGSVVIGWTVLIVV